VWEKRQRIDVGEGSAPGDMSIPRGNSEERSIRTRGKKLPIKKDRPGALSSCGRTKGGRLSAIPKEALPLSVVGRDNRVYSFELKKTAPGRTGSGEGPPLQGRYLRLRRNRNKAKKGKVGAKSMSGTIQKKRKEPSTAQVKKVKEWKRLFISKTQRGGSCLSLNFLGRKRV